MGEIMDEIKVMVYVNEDIMMKYIIWYIDIENNFKKLLMNCIFKSLFQFFCYSFVYDNIYSFIQCFVLEYEYMFYYCV